MPTLAASALPDSPGLPWRGLIVLAVLVVLAHVALLGLAPADVGSRPSPLADKFITRTIVIAPAPAPQQAPAAAAPAATRPPAPPRPVRPRPAARPRPAPAPAPEISAEAEPAAPAIVAQTSSEADATPTPPAAASGPATAAAGPGGGAGTAPDGNPSAADIAGPVALQIPGSVHLAFAATAQQGVQPLQGVFGELVWLQDGTHYDAKLSWTFLFRTLRSQHSTGTIGPTGIEPLRFSDTRKTEVASHFVRDQGLVVFGNNAPSAPLLAGAQDRLSIVLQLGGLLAGDPSRYPPGAVIAIQTVGQSDAEIWTFTVGGEEQLTVPGGEFTARKLTRNPRAAFDDKIELWLAPSLGWLPIRIRQTRTNGDFVDLQMRNEAALAPEHQGE